MVLPSKPLAEIYRIADIFNSYGNWSRAEKNTLIPLRDGEICIIRGGQFSLMRQSDRLLLDKSSAPSVLGLARNLGKFQFIKLQADSECHYQLIPFDYFMQEIEKNHCQLHLLVLSSWIINMLCYREEIMLGRNSFSMIKANIECLAAMDEFMRNRINVADYIVKKTNLSRSMVMKTLSQLRSAKHVEISKGKLLALHSLPDAL
ncbi:helix-turn-helix domain-containing protein [Cronobacter dublinensis]|uniref:helix-turn-helix domain-containing protein n=1 Tax=Cronobacter dublinensis TaxID=413497 RepID=UPI003ADA34B5